MSGDKGLASKGHCRGLLLEGGAQIPFADVCLDNS